MQSDEGITFLRGPDPFLATSNDPHYIPDSHFEQFLQLGFEVGDMLGRGGFGAVYRGQFGPTSLLLRGVKFAVKVQAAVGDPGPMNEARTMVDLNHRHCVRMYHVLHIDTTPWIGDNVSNLYMVSQPASENRVYIFMELANYTARTVWKRFRRNIINTNYLRAWCGQLAAGLNYLHSNSLVHRDLHQGNILFFKNEATNKIDVKIADFGHTRPQKLRTQSFVQDKQEDIRSLARIFEFLADHSENPENRDVVWVVDNMKRGHILRFQGQRALDLEQVADYFGYQEI